MTRIQKLNSITDHGSLLGLSDDDHTQYILVAGTRAFTGNQSFGDFNITNVGDIALDSISGDAAGITITPVSGSSLTISLATTGDLIVNTSQLVVDTSANRIGFGIATPEVTVHLQESTNSSTMRIQNTRLGSPNSNSSKIKKP